MGEASEGKPTVGSTAQKSGNDFSLSNLLKRLSIGRDSKWYYERLTDKETRILPKQINSSKEFSAVIASLLITKNKAYAKIEQPKFVDQIDQEIDQAISSLLTMTGQSEEEFSDLCAGAIGSYRSFMEDTYGITHPYFKDLRIVPTTDKIIEALYRNKQDSGMLFVSPIYPVIFIDAEKVKRHVENIKKTFPGAKNTSEQLLSRVVVMLYVTHEFQHLA